MSAEGPRFPGRQALRRDGFTGARARPERILWGGWSMYALSESEGASDADDDDDDRESALGVCNTSAIINTPLSLSSTVARSLLPL
ncbi:hypothetical protein PTTG_28545 [Puccinia triticina 1-1 BBBD Race 1]|uniref:Uncharacterized protein n=1 Tax=Puccinia triticina (isolate 1-1 / race 1 (BBBD)) TaxID=630390 RepID=A0A180GCV4_PUCT1|nr:hypothetical protein PTTG_28545 [Puccinia triticina 1-1 BBBD Race 1]